MEDAPMRAPLKRAASHPGFIHLMTVLALLYTGYYLYWRAHDSLNQAALWLALPLLLVEVHGALNFILFAFMAWDIPPVPAAPPLPDRTVDIFIPCAGRLVHPCNDAVFIVARMN